MAGLQNDEFAVLVGGAFLALRVLAGVCKVMCSYITDSGELSRRTYGFHS